MAEYKDIESMKSKEMKRNLYLLVSENSNFFASTSKYDMDKYLASNDCSLSPEDVLEGTYNLIFGILLDPKELPYEIPEKIMDKNSLWVIIDKNTYIYIEQFNFIDEVIMAIEEYIDEKSESELSNIVVILGQEIPFTFTSSKPGVTIMSSEVYI